MDQKRIYDKNRYNNRKVPYSYGHLKGGGGVCVLRVGLYGYGDRIYEINVICLAMRKGFSSFSHNSDIALNLRRI